MKGAPKLRLYRVLRWLALLAGAVTCLVVLTHAWRVLPGWEIAFLGLLGAAARYRPVTLRSPAGGGSKIVYHPGEGIFVLALLRDGPAAALATALLVSLLLIPTQRTSWDKHPLETAEGVFTPPALFGLGGWIYVLLGGHPLLTSADSGLFFQHPSAIVLPLALALFVPHDLIHRSYTALLMFCWQPSLVKPYLCNAMISVVVYVECLCAALGLALWTVWGWSTLPFSVLITGTALLSARNYLERVEARRDAESDPLTGLASWRGLENFLRRQIAQSRRARTSFALLFLDADGLKQVNDHHGHAAGDELLKIIGECCRLYARKRDMVGRRGGDEFLLVLTGLERAEAERVRTRLQQAVEDTLAAHSQFAGLAGVSAGLAVYPEDAETEDSLVATADRRMYADKQARKNAVPAG